MVGFRFLFYTLLHAHSFPKGRIHIGKHTYGTPYIFSNNQNNNITIGDYCSIGPGVLIIPFMAHILEKEYEHFRLSTFPMVLLKKNGLQKKSIFPIKGKFVKIGNDVWIGANSIIMPGVTVGDGAIIGASAVVTHDVPPYAIVAGVPAKILRFRFETGQIEKLLRISWWNWPKEKIIENLDYFYDDIDKFIDKFEPH
jgi:acetyltransferase-like isoleucine patch superfamily enzyme